ncbi:MAG: hypothetical protein Q6373_001790 [Candidatus Sigynarchaeota archaeon]
MLNEEDVPIVLVLRAVVVQATSMNASCLDPDEASVPQVGHHAGTTNLKYGGSAMERHGCA